MPHTEDQEQIPRSGEPQASGQDPVQPPRAPLGPESTEAQRELLRQALLGDQLRTGFEPSSLSTNLGEQPEPGEQDPSLFTAKDLGALAVEIPRRGIGGLFRGVQGLWELSGELEQKMNDFVLNQFGDTSDESSFIGWYSKIAGPRLDEDGTPKNLFPEDRLNDVFGKEGESEYLLGNLAEGFGKMIPAFSAVSIATGGSALIPTIAGTGLRSALLGAASRIGIEGARGAVADMLTFDAYAGNLSNIVEDHTTPGSLANSVAALLSVDEDDSFAAAKFKQATEGFMTGAMVDSFLSTARAYRNWRKLKSNRRAGMPIERQDEIAEQVIADLEDAANKTVTRGEGDIVGVVEVEGGFKLDIPEDFARQTEEATKILDPKKMTRETFTTSEGFIAERLEVPFKDPETGVEGVIRGRIDPAEPTVLKDVDINSPSGPNALGRRKVFDLGVELRENFGLDEVEGLRVSGSRAKSAAETGASLNVRSKLPKRRSPKYRTRGEADAQAARMNLALKRRTGVTDGMKPEELTRAAALARELDSTPPEQWSKVLRSGRLNINYGEGAAAGRRLIQALAEANPTQFSKKSREAIRSLAANMFHGMDDKEVLSALKTRFAQTEDLDAVVIGMHRVFDSVGQQIDQLSRVADAFPEDAVIMNELGLALDYARDLATEMVGISGNIGSALQAHQRLGIEGTLRGAVGKALAPRGSPKTFERMTGREIRAYARRIAMAEGDMKSILEEVRLNTEVANKAIKQPKDPSFLDKVNEVRINGMVSGPLTIVSNVLSGVIRLATDPITMVWGGLRSGNDELAREGADIIVGNFLSLRDGLRAFAKGVRNGEGFLGAAGNIGQAFKTGIPVRDSGGVAAEALATTALKGFWGTFINLARRPLIGGDEILKTIAGRSKVRAKSLRLARENPRIQAMPKAQRERAIAQQIEDDLAAHINDRGQFTNMEARDFARDITYTQTLGRDTAGGAFGELLGKVPILRVIHPFHRISVQLFRHAWAHAPILGKYAKQNIDDLAAGGERAAVAQARMEVGSAIYGLSAYLAVSGQMTGQGPRDPRLRKQWLQAGNKPYHLTIGNKQYDMRRVYPISAPLMMTADVVQVSDYLDEDQSAQIPTVIMSAIAATVTSPTFMRGVTDFMDAATGDLTSMENFIESFGSTLVPFSSLVRTLNPDDVYRETNGIIESIMAGVPGLSGQLEPDRNILGELVMRPPGYLNRVLNPFTPKPTGKDDMLLRELLELGRSLPMPSPRKADGFIDLRDRNRFRRGSSRGDQSPYDRMLELQTTREIDGKTMREALTEMVESEDWARASGGSPYRAGGARHKIASLMIEARLEAAFGIVLEEYPELMKEYERELQKNAAALEGPEAVAEIDSLFDHVYRR